MTLPDSTPSPSAPLQTQSPSTAQAPVAPETDLTLPLSGFAAVVEPTQIPAAARALLGAEERPAAAHMSEAGVLADWVARAEWLEREANLDPDLKRKARMLAVASELWAMAGNSGQATATAGQAGKLGSALGGRQARQLVLASGDAKAAVHLLGAETLSAPSAQARAHAAFFAAELARIKLADTAGALKHWELGARITPADPRPHLFKLAKQLGGSGKAPSLQWPDDPALQTLAQAASELSQLRAELKAGPVARSSSLPPTALAESTPEDNVRSGVKVPLVVAFVNALRALARSDREQAARALLTLAEAPNFSRPARWLAAALMAPSKATRPEATQLLKALLREKGSAALRRVLAARALESGDPQGAQLALQQDQRADEETDLAFSPTDHLAVGTLCQADGELLTPWLEHARLHEDLKPLAWAVISALQLPLTQPRLSDPRANAALELAESLAQVKPLPELVNAAEAYDAAIPGQHPLPKLLRLEHAWHTGALEELSKALLAAPLARTDAERAQAEYALGLWYEAAQLTEAADSHYALALRSEPFAEAAARALFTRLSKDRMRKLLATLADSSNDPERRALLLTEALLCDRVGPHDLELCERAHSADPSSPLIPFLGARAARAQKNVAAELYWIQVRLQENVDDLDRTLLLLSQGLLDPLPAARREHLLAAWRLWPRDLALAWLVERELETDARERAKTREQLAALQKDPLIQSQLLLEAAWLFESVGASPDAARTAAAAAVRQPLAEPCLLRNAPGQPQADAIKEHLQRQLSTTDVPERVAEIYLALADLEEREGHAERQMRYLSLATQQVPDHLPTLAALEGQALWRADNKHLLIASSRIAPLLPPQDAPAVVLMAARMERLESGWAAAYPILKQTPRLPRFPLYLTRQLLAQARFMDQHAMAYEMTRRLCDLAVPKSDIAMLNLRAAELAARLEDRDSALSHLRRALDVEPRYLPALALKAHLLQDSAQHADAAVAYEQLAGASRVSAHKVTHWYGAALLWLEKLGDRERGLVCLEHAAEFDPAHSLVFERLRELYQQRGEHRKLEAALNRRLQVVSDASSIAELQLLKSQTLVASGNTVQAREALLLVIKASPENVEALTSLAALSEKDGDALSAEHALLQLVRLSSDPQVQADVYQRLASLYRGPLANPKRALRCYQEVLRRRPQDTAAFDAMLAAYVDTGQTERAVELLEQQLASEPQARRKLELQLQMAALQSSSPNLLPAAEQTYADLLGQWPREERVLRAAASFYVKTERAQYVREWSHRLTQQARAACLAGEFAGAPLGQLETIAEVLADPALALLAASVRQVTQGTPSTFPAALGKAMSRPLDGLLAPASVSSALRSLLMQTRGILDQALELNLGPLAPRTITSERVRAAFEVKARAMGVPMPSELFTTNMEPTLALVTGSPSRVVLGSYWVTEAPPGVLDFVAWRLLKADQARVGLFVHLDARRLETVLLAFLSCFVEVQPSVPEPALFETTRQRVATRLSKTLDDDIPVLALEVLTQMRTAPVDLADAVRRWVNRSALLASGDPESALLALSVLNRGGADKNSARSVLEAAQVKHPEAQDLIVSMLDDAFVEAYRRCRT